MNPAYSLGYASGDMGDRITMSFGEIPKGRLDFYFKDNWVWLKYDVTSFGRQYLGDIKLVPPPYVTDNPYECQSLTFKHWI